MFRENKYDLTKFPVGNTELVTLLHLIGEAYPENYSVLVFPYVIDNRGNRGIGQDSLSLVENAIKHTYGTVLLKAANVMHLYVSATDFSKLENFNRLTVNNKLGDVFVPSFYVNAGMIINAITHTIKIPSNIQTAVQTYRQLADKANKGA